MKKVNNKQLMKKYIELAGTMPSLCSSKEELFEALDNLIEEARKEGMSSNDLSQLTLALNFFKAIVVKRNKNKGGN